MIFYQYHWLVISTHLIHRTHDATHATGWCPWRLCLVIAAVSSFTSPNKTIVSASAWTTLDPLTTTHPGCVDRYSLPVPAGGHRSTDRLNFDPPSVAIPPTYCYLFSSYLLSYPQIANLPPWSLANSNILTLYGAKAIIVPRRIIWSWYTGRWWMGCCIWYSDEGTGAQPAQALPRCTKYNSPPINGQCINDRIAV